MNAPDLSRVARSAGIAALLTVAACSGADSGSTTTGDASVATTPAVVTSDAGTADVTATAPADGDSGSGTSDTVKATQPAPTGPAPTAVVTRPTPNPGPATDAGNWISISALSETAIAVNWSEVEGPDVLYELHRAPWIDGFSDFAEPLGLDTIIYSGTDLDHVDTTMTAGSEYVYAVVADLGDGRRTAPRWRQGDAVNDTEPPTPITELTASLSARGVTLTWAPSTDNYRFRSYAIYRGENGAEPTWIATSPTETQTSFLDDEIPGDVTLTYWVIADDFHENKTEPATVDVIVN